MSFLLTCEIVIDKYKFSYANSIEVESSWMDLGDKCTLKLPNKAVLQKSDTESEEVSLEKTFKTGMSVSIKVGYDGDNHDVFKGYIAHIKPNTPLELVCEDEIYKLKRSSKVSEVYNGSLLGMLQKFFPEAILDAKLPRVTLTNFIIKQATQAEILDKLKKEYGFCAYFRGKTLYVGITYFEGLDTKHILHFQKNVIDSALEYKKEEDVRIKAKAISILSNNSKIDIETGDSDGEQRTFYFYNITSKEELKKLADNELKKLKFEGYTGTITKFGEPFIRHSETVALYDDKYSERKGQRYLVDKVKTSWGMEGFRQVIDISKKIA